MQKGNGLGGTEEEDTHWSRTENSPPQPAEHSWGQLNWSCVWSEGILKSR